MLEIDISLFYLIVLIAVSCALLLIGVLFLYLGMVKKFLKLKDEVKKRNDDESLKFQETIQKANLQAQEIINKAELNSQTMISDTQKYMDEIRSKITQQISNTPQMYANTYNELITVSKQEMVKVIHTISKDIIEGLNSEIKNFGLQIGKDLSTQKDEAKLILQKAYQKIEEELQNYKTQRLKQIEDSMFNLVNNVLEQVLRKKINKNEHDELLIKALEEAKKEGVL